MGGSNSWVNIGRSTVFGSPIKMIAPCPVCRSSHRDAGSTGACYRQYLTARLSPDAKQRDWAVGIAGTVYQMPIQDGFAEAVKALAGKRLYCPGCGVDSPTCHGRILEAEVRRLNEREE